MAHNEIGAPTIGGDSIAAAAGVAAAEVALPKDSGGEQAKYYYMAATANVYVKFGPTGMTDVSAADGMLILGPFGSGIVIGTRETHISVLRLTGDGILQVTPLAQQ